MIPSPSFRSEDCVSLIVSVIFKYKTPVAKLSRKRSHETQKDQGHQKVTTKIESLTSFEYGY